MKMSFKFPVVFETANTPRAASLWVQRYQTFGHTGWKDPVIYAYDQVERLALVRSVLPSGLPGRVALDFGCGTGDFSSLLLTHGYTVHGYDPYVEPRIRSPGFSYAKALEEVHLSENGADVVLSITTLDHILSSPELKRVLCALHNYLKSNGVLVMLEYALDSEGDRLKWGLSKNDYQAFRTVSDWTYLLNGAGLSLASVSAAPHPTANPSQGYVAYSHSRLIRTWRKLPRRLTSRKWLQLVLRQHAKQFIPEIPGSTSLDGTSPLKLICCQRRP